MSGPRQDIDFWDRVYVRRGDSTDSPLYSEPTPDEWTKLQRGSLADAARAAAPPVKPDNEARYREHDDEGNHIADHPVRAAPPVAEGIVQQAHVPCCWCGEHHEAGA